MYRVLSFPQTQILGISHSYLEGEKLQDKKSVLLATRDHCVALYNIEDSTCQSVWYFKGVKNRLQTLSEETTFRSQVLVTKGNNSTDDINYSVLYGDRDVLSWNPSYHSIEDLTITSLPDDVFTILYRTSSVSSLIIVYTDGSVGIGEQRVYQSHIDR